MAQLRAGASNILDWDQLFESFYPIYKDPARIADVKNSLSSNNSRVGHFFAEISTAERAYKQDSLGVYAALIDICIGMRCDHPETSASMLENAIAEYYPVLNVRYDDAVPVLRHKLMEAKHAKTIYDVTSTTALRKNLWSTVLAHIAFVAVAVRDDRAFYEHHAYYAMDMCGRALGKEFVTFVHMLWILNVMGTFLSPRIHAMLDIYLRSLHQNN